MCNLAPQKVCWISQFPTSIMVQYVVHGSSTVTCVLIDKGYTVKLILGQRMSLGLQSPRWDSGLRTQGYGFPDSAHTLRDLSVVGNLAVVDLLTLVIFNQNCVDIIESTNRNCAYNPLIDTAFLNSVLQLFSYPFQ